MGRSPQRPRRPSGASDLACSDFAWWSQGDLREVYNRDHQPMTLEAGSRLGPYEILSPLGAGGMGEVYRAKDTRLDRTVAIRC